MTSSLPPDTGRQPGGFAPGTLIGGYRLEAPVGAGGMAAVYRARDESLDRTVALKILAPLLTVDAEFRERFIRESRAASLVDHPNIIPVYAAGEDAGVLYLAMRYVPGGDLHSVVEREGPLPSERAVALTAPVASALDAAHRAGIVHRDVKPANVLVDVSPGRPDHPYLSDFGLAKRDAAASLTNAGEFVGTAGFAAPEQIDGRPARFESDQYALACVVFTLLTASLPFRSRYPEAVLWAQMSQPPPRVTPARPDLPAAVDDVLARALAKDPGDRFPDCASFIDALRQAMAGAPPSGGSPSFAPPVPQVPTTRDTPATETPPATDAPAVTDARPAGRRRVRGSRIAAGAGAVVVIAAAAAAGAAFLAPGQSRGTLAGSRAAGVPVPAPVPAPALKVSATLAAMLQVPGGDSASTAAFGPDGTLVTAGSSGTAYTFALASRQVAHRADMGVLGTNGGLISLNGQFFAASGAGCLSGGVGPCHYQVFQYNGRGWDADLPAGPSSPVAVSEAAMAITTPAGNGVQVLNLQTLSPVTTVTDPDRRAAASIALSPDGDTVAAAGAATGTTRPAYVWNLASPTAPTVMTIPAGLGVTQTSQNNPSRLPLAVAGSTLAASNGLTTNVYHLGTRNPATSVPADLLALSPDGKVLATSDPGSAAGVDLRNAATGQTAATLTAPAEQYPPATVVFSTDGRSVAVCYSDGLIRVWRLSVS